MAQGDDPAVLDHNPALLTRFTRTTLTLSLSTFVYEGRFRPLDDPLLGEGLEVKNEKPLTFIPHLYSAIPLGRGVVLGAGWYTPINPGVYQFPAGSGARYQVQRAETNLILGTVALAYTLPVSSFPLALAVAGDLGYATAEVLQSVGVLPGFATLDGTLSLKGQSPPLPRVRAGLSYPVLPGLTLGFTYAQGFHIRVHGDLSVEVPVLGIAGKDEVEVRQRYPSEFRLGIGYRAQPYRAELALRGYRFSEYRAQTLDLKANTIERIPVPDMTIPKHTRDTWAVQVGAGYEVWEKGEVRAGYMYDPSAFARDSLSLTEFDATKHLVALGYGIRFADFTLDLAASLIFYEKQTVAQPSPAQGALLGISPSVNSGEYRRSDQVYSLSLGYSL